MKRPHETAYTEKSTLQESKDFLESLIDQNIFELTADSITDSKELRSWLKSYDWELVQEFQEDVKYFKIKPLK